MNRPFLLYIDSEFLLGPEVRKDILAVGIGSCLSQGSKDGEEEDREREEGGGREEGREGVPPQTLSLWNGVPLHHSRKAFL